MTDQQSAAAAQQPDPDGPAAAPALPGQGRADLVKRTQASPRLSRTQAEHVIRRALELEDLVQDDGGADPALTLADVTEIARQLGVQPRLVQRALTDVRMDQAADHGPTGLQRIIGQPHVAAATVVPADPDRVRRSAARWMAEDEGMVRTGRRGDTDRWVRDKRLLVNLRRGLQVDRGTGTLRDLRGIGVTVTPDAQGAVVVIEADTRSVQATGAGLAVGGSVLSALLGVGAAAVVPDSAAISSDAAQFAVTFIPAIAATAGTTLAVTRTWIRKVREGVEQALDGITMTTVEPRLPQPPPESGGWRETAMRWLGGGQ